MSWPWVLFEASKHKYSQQWAMLRYNNNNNRILILVCVALPQTWGKIQALYTWGFILTLSTRQRLDRWNTALRQSAQTWISFCIILSCFLSFFHHTHVAHWHKTLTAKLILVHVLRLPVNMSLFERPFHTYSWCVVCVWCDDEQLMWCDI